MADCPKLSENTTESEGGEIIKLSNQHLIGSISQIIVLLCHLISTCLNRQPFYVICPKVLSWVPYRDHYVL